MANEGYHEPIDELTDATRDMHRAITSLMEELEAVDWYNQRVDACKDESLKQILIHNRDEEKRLPFKGAFFTALNIINISHTFAYFVFSVIEKLRE